jgi:hypothetical protein
MKILAPFIPRIGGGGVITAVADYPDQALYWELVSFDPATGLEGVPFGSLKWDHTRTDKAGLAVNIYLAPALVYSGAFTCGNGVYCGQGRTCGGSWPTTYLDRVKVKWG